MSPNIFFDLKKLSDRDLLTRIHELVGEERELTATLVAHLAVLDERQLYLSEGCSSLFTYCTQVLHFSEHAAYNRIEAARAARTYPVILEMLANGSVNMTTVRLLAPALTPANHREVLEAARHKTRRQIEELLAHLRPQHSLPTIIRKFPLVTGSPAPTGTTPGDVMIDIPPATATAHVPDVPPPPPVARPAAHPAVVPLAPQRYRIYFTAGAEAHALLRRAQNLLRHQIPDGDVGKIMELALAILVRDLEKRKFAATTQPRPSRGSHLASRHIPADVKREVWQRDGGACAFVAHNGRQCGERAFVEFHHVVPHSANGPATVENIELRCRAHNGYEAGGNAQAGWQPPGGMGRDPAWLGGTGYLRRPWSAQVNARTSCRRGRCPG